ncbi:MAG: M15 family metallopeptidase [Marinagarivorans sp.]|nr:M15 family metallopeptidase [Marinagarivorans sp.]
MFKLANAMGLDSSHVIPHVIGGHCLVPMHKQLALALERLFLAAKEAGFELGVASGFRSFDRQRTIWNAKADGQRLILSADETPLDTALLNDDEKLLAIMHWSAIPGTSRHHWGTDCDVYDATALGTKTLALTVVETQTLFAPFYTWLDTYLIDHPEWVRPYMGRGPVACEPWHLSYAPLAMQYQRLIVPQVIMAQLLAGDIRLIDCVMDNWPALYEQYVAAYFVK